MVVEIGFLVLSAIATGILTVVFKRMFGKIAEVHVLVNSQMDQAQRDIANLIREAASLKEEVQMLKARLANGKEGK